MTVSITTNHLNNHQPIGTVNKQNGKKKERQNRQVCIFHVS